MVLYVKIYEFMNYKKQKLNIQISAIILQRELVLLSNRNYKCEISLPKHNHKMNL